MSDLPAFVTCLSLHQPYAGLVAAGVKTIETRPWAWPKTRPLPQQILVCATAAPDKASVLRLATRIESHPDRARLVEACSLVGQALALVTVVGCRPLLPEDEAAAWFYAAGRFAFTLRDVRRVRPFPIRGSQGFSRTVPRGLVESALAAWEVR